MNGKVRPAKARDGLVVRRWQAGECVIGWWRRTYGRSTCYRLVKPTVQISSHDRFGNRQFPCRMPRGMEVWSRHESQARDQTGVPENGLALVLMELGTMTARPSAACMVGVRAQGWTTVVA